MTQEVFTKQFFQATRMWLFKFVAPLFVPSLAWAALHYLAIHRFLTATSPIFTLAGYCLNFAVVAANEWRMPVYQPQYRESATHCHCITTTRFALLCDRIPIRGIGTFSIGDILLILGLVASPSMVLFTHS